MRSWFVALVALLGLAACPARTPTEAARPTPSASIAEPSTTVVVGTAPPSAPSPSGAPSSPGPATTSSETSAPDPVATVPAATAQTPLHGHCLDVRTLEASGETHSCYPYRCVVDRCLDKCSVAATHCAPFAGPGMDPAKFGWPLECILGRCVPMNPSKVNPKGPP